MSWSVNAVGKPQKVAQKLAQDFARVKCAEPEESLKNNAASSVAAALAAFPPTIAVRVEASGSQFVPDATKPGEVINTLYVKIEPLHGFIE